MPNVRTVQVANKNWDCAACLGVVPKGEYYVKDQQLTQVAPRTTISGKAIQWHLQCAPKTRKGVDEALAKSPAQKLKEYLMMVNNLPCEQCGLDNRNGTHDALTRSGHIDHVFKPAIPDPLASSQEPVVADTSRPVGMEFSPTEEMIASLRHIALNGCRCETDEDMFSNCACDAARTAQLTLEQLNIGLVP